MPSNMAMYGFTAPDSFDELVVVATPQDLLYGKHFPPMQIFFEEQINQH